MRSVFKAFLLSLLCLILCMAAASAAGDIAIQADFGYDGTVTYLAAVPLHVTLKNAGEDADVTVSVDIYRSRKKYDTYTYPVTLAGGAQKRLTIPVMLSYKQSAYIVNVWQGETLLTSANVVPETILAPTTLLVGVLSDQPQTLSYMNIGAANDELMRGDVWQTVNLTQESFPDSYEMLRAFSMLAIDGVDVSQFSVAQQQALETWLKNGGIAIVGGGTRATAAYRGFSVLAGVGTGAPYTADNVSQALMDALADTQFPVSTAVKAAQGTSMLLPLQADHLQTVVQSDGQALIVRANVGNGLVYATAFSLSDKVLAGWNGMSCYWQRLLLANAGAEYQALINARGSYYSGRDFYLNTSLLSLLKIANDQGMRYPAIAVAAFLLLAGVGSYLVLKKLDKREWLWLSVPLLSACCVGILCLMGSRMHLSDPAVASYSAHCVSSDGKTSSAMIAGVACAANEEIAVGALDGAGVTPASDYYSYYDDYDDTQTQTSIAPQMRYRYTLGDTSTLTFKNDSAWEVNALYIQPEQTEQLALNASIWWEDDGLHGQIVNNTAYALEEGLVLTMYGYCNVPRLLPGQTAQIAIVENPQRAENGAFDGELIDKTKNYNVNAFDYIEAIIYAALYPNDPAVTYDSEKYPDNRTEEEKAFVQQRRNMINVVKDNWYQDSSTRAENVFHYVTYSKDIAGPQLVINGQKAERTAHMAIVDVEFKYIPVSSTGVVKVPGGMAPLYEAALQYNNVPYRITTKAGLSNGYLDLRAEPVICFALGEVDGIDTHNMTLSSMTLMGEMYSSAAVVRIYDAATGTWDTLAGSGLPLTIGGEDLTHYVDDEGCVYLRITQSGSAYGEIYYPMLSFEGRMR